MRPQLRPRNTSRLILSMILKIDFTLRFHYEDQGTLPAVGCSPTPAEPSSPVSARLRLGPRRAHDHRTRAEAQTRRREPSRAGRRGSAEQLCEAGGGRPGPDQTTGTRSPRDARHCRTRASVPRADRRAGTRAMERGQSGQQPNGTPNDREHDQPSAAPTLDSARQRSRPDATRPTQRGSKNEKDAFGEPSTERGQNSRSGGCGLGGERVSRPWASPRRGITSDYQTAPTGTRRRACLAPLNTARKGQVLPRR
jgi:hypothetical protein